MRKFTQLPLERTMVVLHNRNDSETALHAHKEATDEIKSDQREGAAAARSRD